MTIRHHHFRDEAREAVRKRWIEQGIWNDKWNFSGMGEAFYEGPLFGTESDAEADPPFAVPLKEPQQQRVYEDAGSEVHQKFRDQVEAEIQKQPKHIKEIRWITFKLDARRAVKKRWIEQGIWNDKWSFRAMGQYLFEQTGFNSESDTEANPPLAVPSEQPQPQARPAMSNEERDRTAERRAVRWHEHGASRPDCQLFYLMTEERERLEENYLNDESVNAANINTRAYEIIKEAWIDSGIWNTEWGILPGLFWKHEEPFVAKKKN